VSLSTFIRLVASDGLLKRRGGGTVNPKPPSLEGIGLIGDGLTYQGGSTDPRDAFIAQGWPDDATTRVDGLSGRGLAMPGTVHPDVGEVIDSWRAGSFDPGTVVIALGMNNLGATDTAWSNWIKAILDKIAAGSRAEYKVFWVLFVLRRDPPPTDPNATQTTIDRFQAVVESLVGYNSKVNLVPLDIESHIHDGRDESTLWDTADPIGKFMTPAGYAIRNDYIAALTPTDPPLAVNIKFPGYIGEGTGNLYWGLDEFDQDPESLHPSEEGRPETLAKVRAAFMRVYYGYHSTSSNAPGPHPALDGAARTQAAAQLAKGRIPWISIKYRPWDLAADGRNSASWDSWITWVEEEAQGPVWFSIMHEPENQTISKGGTEGTEAQWYALQKAFRARMTAYANAHGGVDSYKWKNLAFSACLTANAYRVGANAGGIDRYVPTPNDHIFDFMGADYYVWTTTAPLWGTNAVKFMDWCMKYGYPTAFGEWGVQRDDPQGAPRLQEFYNRCIEAQYDCFAAAYFNSSEGQTSGPRQWMLENTATNQNMLAKFVNQMKAATSIHFWDVRRPDGGTYSRPAGATIS
jgi:hypothetical protein